MMKLIIGSSLEITGTLPENLTKWMKKNLVFPNPEYIKKLRMGYWVGNTPKDVTLYQITHDAVIIPYGCLEGVFDFFSPDDEIENTFTEPHLAFFSDNKIPLYDYQRPAVRGMSIRYCGILQAPAGSGKTQMGLALAQLIGRKTLWLTHTHDLLQQSYDRAAQYWNPDDFGVISEGKVQIGRTITFATIQTMTKCDLTALKDEWDVIIVDECHRVAGTPTAVTMFSRVLNNLRARHKYGLSATVHRADGLIKSTYAFLGPVRYTVSEEAVADKIMKVRVLPVEVRSTSLCEECLNEDGTINYQKMITYLCEDEERNEVIVRNILSDVNNYNLVLSSRVSHLRTLMDMLPDQAKKYAVMIDGSMVSKKGKEQRQQAIEDMRSGKKHILFATFQLAKEGLDIPRLDRLHLVCPQKDYAVVTQSIGRIARTFPDKGQPIAYDYVDTGMRNMVKAYKQRCTSYRKARCEIG